MNAWTCPECKAVNVTSLDEPQCERCGAWLVPRMGLRSWLLIGVLNLMRGVHGVRRAVGR